jgi:8-amino-7-oxononanoate synthase
VAVALREALKILEEEPERRGKLTALADHARQRLHATLGLKLPDTHILPVIIGESEPTLRIAESVQAAGFDVRAIRPPTVPAGTSRLRLSITLHVNEATIDALVKAIGEAMPTDGRSARQVVIRSSAV